MLFYRTLFSSIHSPQACFFLNRVDSDFKKETFDRKPPVKSQMISLKHTLSCRVRLRRPIRSAGVSWRVTSCSTRKVHQTETWQESLFWRAALSSCVSLRSSLLSLWCGASQACVRTSLPLTTRRVRRVGSKLCCRPTTGICPCCWWTWRRNTEVRDMNADTGSGGSKRELLFCFAAVTEVTSLFTVETPQKSWGHSGGSELRQWSPTSFGLWLCFDITNFQRPQGFFFFF